MDLRKLAFRVGVCALALIGCGPSGGGGGGGGGTVFPERDFACEAGAAQPCATTVEVNTDAERTAAEGTELDNATLVFVMNDLTSPDAIDGAVAGFNLDATDSGEGFDDAADCEGQQPDYISTADPDHIGVDNQFAASVAPLLEGAASIDLNATLLEQINTGSLILMMEVTGVESLENDAEIELQLLLGSVPDGATLEIDSATGALAAGQSFMVMEELGDPVRGDIFQGRVRAAAPSIELSLDVMGMPLSLVIQSPELRFDIAESGLTNGVIGGFITVQSIIDTISMIPDLADFVGPASMILSMYADLQPSADDPNTCDSISIGLSFGATTATATR
jgi:hypothetical protein